MELETLNKNSNLKKGLIIIAVVVIATFAIIKLRSNDEQEDASSGPSFTPPIKQPRIYDSSNLPKGVCGKVITNFGNLLDYVKCDGVWYATQREGNIEWKSLADNSTAMNLLNNKYPDAEKKD
jgi:hypothetical protein